MEHTDPFHLLILSQEIVQVHGASAADIEDMPDSQIRKKPDHIVGYFHINNPFFSSIHPQGLHHGMSLGIEC